VAGVGLCGAHIPLVHWDPMPSDQRRSLPSRMISPLSLSPFVQCVPAGALKEEAVVSQKPAAGKAARRPGYGGGGTTLLK
jgi:hypothetical protein